MTISALCNVALMLGALERERERERYTYIYIYIGFAQRSVLRLTARLPVDAPPFSEVSVHASSTLGHRSQNAKPYPKP